LEDKNRPWLESSDSIESSQLEEGFSVESNLYHRVKQQWISLEMESDRMSNSDLCFTFKELSHRLSLSRVASASSRRSTVCIVSGSMNWWNCTLIAKRDSTIALGSSNEMAEEREYTTGLGVVAGKWMIQGQSWRNFGLAINLCWQFQGAPREKNARYPRSWRVNP
jgi:hypothetical protein